MAAGSHRLDRDRGTLRVLTQREGVAQRIGHDLVLEVEDWQATIEVEAHGVSAVALEAGPRSLRVREARHGIKPLSDSDRSEIQRNIDEKILRGLPIAFASTSVEARDGGLAVTGELTMAGATRPVSFAADMTPDGRVRAEIGLEQSAWGIRPYRAFMGALKLRDRVEVVFEAALPGRLI